MFVCSLPPKVLLLAPLQLDSELVFSNYVATDSGNGMPTADGRRDRVQPERVWSLQTVRDLGVNSKSLDVAYEALAVYLTLVAPRRQARGMKFEDVT